MRTEKNLYSKIIDYIILLSIGIFSLLYSVFWSNFAELHILLPFLDFPIFVGEILLGSCVLLLLLKWKLDSIKFNRWYFLLLIYVVWLLGKAFWGYYTYGPLSFRTAALFYYPLFAVISYGVFRKELFTQKIIYFLFLILIFAKTTVGIHSYSRLPYLILLIILALKIKNKWIKPATLALLIFIFSYKDFLYDSKSAIISNMMAFLFLIYCLSSILLKIKRRYQILVAFLITLILIMGVLKFGHKSQIKALTMPLNLVKQFKEADKLILERKKSYTPATLAVGIYNPEKNSLSDSLFLRLNSRNTASTLKEAIKSLNKDVIIANVNTNAEITRIAVISAIERVCEVIHITLKWENAEMSSGGGGSMEDQEKTIAALGEKTEIVIQQAVADIDGQKKVAIENITAFLEKQKKDWVSLEEAEEIIARMIIISPEIPIKKAIHELYQWKVFFRANDYAKESPVSFVEEAEETKETELAMRIKKTKKMSKDEIANIIGYQELAMKKAIDIVQQYKDAESPGVSRPVSHGQSNMLFRLFIWRDMMSELIYQRPLPIFGINFGKPQRSISLELLAAGFDDWVRDGWITPHNSYLHLIYRGGIVGVCMIIALLVVLLRLAKRFIVEKSVTGIFLMSILVFWLTIANFLVVLELPYQAIAFWSSLGMALAYSKTFKVST